MASTSFPGWNSGTQIGDNSGTVNINNHLPPDSGLPNLPCVPEAIFNHSKHEDETSSNIAMMILDRNLAKNYRDQNVSFMFQKGNGDCGSFRKFVTTVAIQLVAKSPHIKKSVHDALRSDPSILDQGIEDQWSRLVLEPLEHPPDPATPYVLVIDALDECVNGEWLLDKRLQKRPSGLRILITSRPHLLRPNLNESRYHHVVLHDLDPDIVNQDILRFLQMTLEKRRPGWPDKSSLKLLEEMSSLYLTILREYVSLQNWETDVQSTCCSLVRHYLGSLVVLFDQLPPRSLYRLIPREARGPDIHEILGNLGSILDFPSDEDNCIDKIRIHHPTFREFLLDRERCTDNKFYVEKEQAHKIVLGGCLDLLLSTLKRDISQTEGSMFLDYGAGQSHTRQALLPEIQYACLYWVAHFTESGENVHGNDTISRLLFEHSLHWLEILGCMGRSLDALIALERLSLLAKCDENSEVFKFIEDLTLFTRHHRNLIDEHPRQLNYIYTTKTNLY
ncbi:hypothetical protein PENSOL_c014G04933 [Penicillium solitum]|uniref:Nephrocystin 3-like N-terminal domain-containing protein n=1 Tax=Penicillium solitum TaxID=60172 RepID=A0A1V6R5U4_9EURO|nr:uncharacterized protein PENSOL_c014G04933 [Penicillium solitum]OQD96830.1 hypothetical protein PENSOL_c014G04933 [Penicillium solitum]